jgi:hypothetical protein
MKVLILIIFHLLADFSSSIHSTINPFRHYNHTSPTFPKNRLCYSQLEDLLKEIPGNWVNSSSHRIAKYWNLSCPMEVSKQACSHFGPNFQPHAEYAAHLEFHPSTCSLLSLDILLPLVANLNKTIIFIGNSLIRQVILGIACNAYSMNLIDRFELKWIPCGRDGLRYPCHGATNCIECGPYSGFDHDGAKVYFKGGTILELVESYQTEEKHFAESNDSSIGYVIAQRWHLEGDGLIKHAKHKKAHALPLPKLIWWNGYSAHFQSGGGLLDGRYNEVELKKLKAEAGGAVVDCLKKLDPMDPLVTSHTVSIFEEWKPSGFLQIQGINDFGDAKVGNVVGKFGDCQHFCSPGPADMLAIPLMQLILALEEK